MLDVTRIRERFARTKAVPKFKGYGVLTAADAGFFPGLQLLVASLGDDVPLGIVDLGLTAEQRDWCFAQKRYEILPRVGPMPDDVKMWQGWNKPYYMATSPFDRTLWIDSDCVVIGDLQPLFHEIEQGPFVIRHWDEPYPQPNHSSLYHRFRVPVRLPPGRGINSGVVGLKIDRDAELLEAWSGLVSHAAMDPTIRPLISWYDEGALQWALEETGTTERVLPWHGWNRFVRSQVTADPVDYVLAVSGQADDVIWHFSGIEKPWNLGSY